MTVDNSGTKTMRIDIRPDRQEATDERHREPMRPGEPGGSAAASREAQLARTPDYGQLLQSIYDGVFVADAEGRIIDFNSRAVDFFVRDARELPGTNVIDLISGAGEDLLASIHRNLRNHKYTLIEAYCRRRGRSTFPAEIAVNKITLDDQERLCFFVRDISVRKKAQQDLEQAVARLEELDRARTQFVSNVSHELRTPLTSMIYAVANMLRGVVGPLPDRVRKYLEMLNGDCKRLLGTVSDILDLQRIEDKTLALQTATCAFAPLVRASAESLRVQAEQKGLSLEIRSDDRRRFVECDAQKIERVILNIVGNAVKFTPAAGRVCVSVGDAPGRPAHVRVSVQDTGIGIPPEAIPRVTLRYVTVGEQPSGSGLGLAISKEIVKLHGGTIDIESPPPGADAGTVVTVELPVADPPLVLVVDADPQTRGLLSGEVDGDGYRVLEAADGAQALELARDQRPDVIVLDLALPDVEGMEVILRLKGDKASSRIPVIAVSGTSLGEAKAKLLEGFSIPALSKPWHSSHLLEVLSGAVTMGALSQSGVPVVQVRPLGSDVVGSDNMAEEDSPIPAG